MCSLHVSLPAFTYAPLVCGLTLKLLLLTCISSVFTVTTTMIPSITPSTSMPSKDASVSAGVLLYASLSVLSDAF